MRTLGFEPVAVDGQPALGSAALPSPKSYGRHRPDAIGESAEGEFCIGEAKTADDIRSRRTREQLEDYLAPEGESYAYVVLGYPSSASHDVEGILRRIGASHCPQLVRLTVPDELLHA